MTRPVSVRRRRNQQGVVTLLYTLMMLFIIIPMVGLAIDAGIVYTVKAKLQAAVDGASLAAARSLGPIGNPTSFATNVVHTNFPTGWMSVNTVPDPTVTITTNQTGVTIPTWETQDGTLPLGETQVAISETISAPTWFMRILGFNSVSMTASGSAVRRNVNVMFVVDRSYSLQQEGNCTTLKTDAQEFVNNFVEGQDEVALVTFGTSFNYDFAFNTTFKTSVNNLLSNMTCNGFTNAAAGFSYGFQQLKGLPAATTTNALNVIVFFTDGEPNTMTFGVNTSSATFNPNGSTPLYGTTSSLTYNPLPVATSSNCNPHASGTYMSGVLAGDLAENYWGGLLQWWNNGIGTSSINGGDFNPANNTAVTSNPSGCAFETGSASGPGASPSFRVDVASLPAADAFGNSTNSTWAGGSSSPFPYSVQLTGSSWYTLQNLENAGINTLDNAAQNARSAASTAGFPYVVYTIGLNPTSLYGTVNQELLRRVANDPLSAVHQSTYASGQFYYVPNSGALAGAFAQVASDILRIAK